MKDAQQKGTYANKNKGRKKDRNIKNLGSNLNKGSCCNISGPFEILSVGKFQTKNSSESTDRAST